MFIDFRERRKESERKRERERNISMREKHQRNIDQLPPVHALIRDPIQNLGMCPDW